MMTSSDTRIIRSTLTALASRVDSFSTAFNKSLNKRDPKLHAILSAQHLEAGRPFAMMLAVAIESLTRPDVANGSMFALGQRRQAYSWQPRHDAIVGQAFIAALADTLGEAFDEDARQAWTDGYVQLAETMLAATCNRMGLVA